MEVEVTLPERLCEIYESGSPSNDRVVSSGWSLSTMSSFRRPTITRTFPSGDAFSVSSFRLNLKKQMKDGGSRQSLRYDGVSRKNDGNDIF